MMNTRISSDIAAAKSRIIEAELALGAAISITEGGPRADKVTINSAVGEALKRLKDAVAILDALEISDAQDEQR